MSKLNIQLDKNSLLLDENYHLFGHTINKTCISNCNKNLSSEELYEKKKKSRQTRQNNLTFEQTLFLTSIFDLQVRKGWSDAKFCKILNLKSERTIRNWRYLTGHFPSKRVLSKLLSLLNKDNITMIVVKNKMTVGVYK